MISSVLRRKLLQARDIAQPAIRVSMGPHLSKYVLVADVEEGILALHGEPNSRTAGERYPITSVDEVSETGRIKHLDDRLERIRRFLDLKHKEHLVPAA